jgi:hypothetical protein
MPTSNNERPASRAEIFSLEKELEDKVRMVLDSATFLRRTNEEFGAEFAYQPHRENVINTRDKMLGDLGATTLDIEEEPWLDSYLKCECLKVVCDEVSSQFSDIIGVSSTELGNVSRKLRLTYKQCFEQLAESWKSLRGLVKSGDTEIKDLTTKVQRLEEQVKTKEEEVIKRFDDDIARMHRDFALEKERDQEKIAQAQFKMDQMADTLKYLNGIFRTMQNDGSTLKTTDLQTVVSRLEKENRELKSLNNDFDSIKVQLSQAQQRVRQLEGQIFIFEDEKSKIQAQMTRRDEAIASLMEREAVRAAEIEKLQKMAKIKDDELLSLDMKDPATSVLCIKCKRSLDDLTNIKAALMGDQAMGKIQRVQCESFRILLPNLKNRKPSRSNAWLRNSMRCILMAKMREHLAWQQLKPDVIRFPAFVYSWFSRKTTGLAGSTLTKMLVACDEDRWALYYGCRSLGKDDPEAALFWSLLDEAYGQDGLHFLLHCLGVVLALGGTPLWNQFGRVLTHGASIEEKPDDAEVHQTIWLDLTAAREAVSLILTRALSVHVNAALEAIEALKVTPQDLDQSAASLDANTVLASESSDSLRGPNISVPAPSAPAPNSRLPASSKDATHVNLFTFLRVLQQQLHADKIHRSAAIRLMFETASVGALTPALPFDGNNANTAMGHNLQGVTNTHVEYPQFQSICLTLFPRMAVAEVAGLYAVCHQHGQRRVSAEIFTQEADLRGLFVRSMLLPSIPLLRHLVIGCSNSGGDASEDVFVSSPVAYAVATSALASPDAPTAAAPPSFGPKVKLQARSQLAVLVHRKMASIKPLLTDYLLPRLPNVWKATLQDALHTVQISLDESFAQLRALRKKEEEGAAGVTNRLISGSPSKNTGKSFSATAGSSSNLKAVGSNTASNPLLSAMNTAVSAVTGAGGNSMDPITAQAVNIADTYLDGIQPYLAYRRLLSLLSLALTVNDNPLVPAELFTSRQLSSNTDRVVKRAESMLAHLEEAIVLPIKAAVEGQDLGVHQLRVERLLKQYECFEDTRRQLVARKMQLVARQFVQREVAVPRSVRMLLAAGYLSDHRNRQLISAFDIKRSISQATANSPMTNSVATASAAVAVFAKTQGLRWREVFVEPWVGSSSVASIYLFKLDYDLKAARLGLSPLSLPQAVSAYFYHVLGTATAAERSLQDLFVCVRSYRHCVSRLRLFSLFLGDCRDSGLVSTMSATSSVAGLLQNSHMSSSAAAAAIAAEESGQMLVSILASAQALAVYMQLLVRIHSAVNEVVNKFTGREGEADEENSAGVLSSRNKQQKRANKTNRLVIDTLFPSSENPVNRQDKRDIWMEDAELLAQVAKAWTRRQQRHWYQTGMQNTAASGSSNIHAVYIDLPGKLKPDAQGRIDVDDFLYLMVLQWAKLQVWQLQRVASRGQQMNSSTTSSSAAVMAIPKQQQSQQLSLSQRGGMLSRRLSQLPLSALQSIADSVYQQRLSDAVISNVSVSGGSNNSHGKRRITSAGREARGNEGGGGGTNAAGHHGGSDSSDGKEAEELLLLSDPMHYAAAYVRCIRSRRFALSLPDLPTAPTGSPVATTTKSGGGALTVQTQSQLALQHEHELLSRMSRIEKRMVKELQVLIRETVLWDTNLGLFLSPQRILWRHTHSHLLVPKRPGSAITSTRAVSNASAHVVHYHGSDSNTSMTVAKRTTAGSTGKIGEETDNGDEEDEEDLFALDILVTEACAPEYLYNFCKQIFQAYHSVIHSFLASALAAANAQAQDALETAATVGNSLSKNNTSSSAGSSNKSNTNGNNISSGNVSIPTAADDAMVHNVRQRVQSMRAQLLSLVEFFSQPEQTMASDRLHHLYRLGAAPEDVVELETARQQHRHLAREAQFLLRSLISNVAELAVVAQLEFPRDNWHAGAKLHIDRSYIYSVHLRPSL